MLITESRKTGLDFDAEMIFGKNLHRLFNEITDTIETLEKIIRSGAQESEYIDELLELDRVIMAFNTVIEKSYYTVFSRNPISSMTAEKIIQLKNMRKKMKYHVSRKRAELKNIRPLPKIIYR